jgi:large subunit ribosomal protein L9
MKLLLCKNVPTLGIVGDIVEVNEGYARNYLMPRRLATEPTQVNVRRLSEARRQAEEELARERAVLESIAQKIEGLEVTIRARANEDGALYGSVGRREIATAIAEEGHHVAAEQIQLHQPLRRLDNVEVEIRFASDLRCAIKVWVVREKTGEEGEGDEEGQKTVTAGREAGADDNSNDQ